MSTTTSRCINLLSFHTMSKSILYMLLLSHLLLITNVNAKIDAIKTMVPNSCLNQKDGDNYVIKLLDGDSYPALNVQCSNEYMIVNLHQDLEWKSYFRSLRQYHYNLLGPEKDDHSNWQEWMVAQMDSFVVSPDCSSCDESHILNQQYGHESAYYMTPVTAGCTQLPIGRIGCDMDWHSYACRVCETSETREPGYWHSYEVYNGLNNPNTTLHFEDEVGQSSFAKYGLCGFTIRDAKAPHSLAVDSYEHCKTVTHEDVEGDAIMPRRKPSIGQDGRFCMCMKPKVESFREVGIPTEQYLAKKRRKSSTTDTDISLVEEEFDGLHDGEVDSVTQLYQKDFMDGTYRITEPGKYVLMEDIVFDFKAPKGYKEGNLDSYNGPDAWWPTVDQADKYPGAGGLKGSYMFGFWAGITIECADVILEMADHKIEMSEAFYYQQSFFALISLSSQIFLPGQGPGFFGADPQNAENVMIRNGELGLSSHHGIQGNFNKNVLIENVKIHSFKTHGIQFNGFDGVTFKNVDVGHNRKVDRLSPYYAHMKALLPIYRSMVENEEAAQDVCVHFASQRYWNEDGTPSDCKTMSNLIDDVVTVLDMAFEHVLFDKDWNEIPDNEKKRSDLWKLNGDILINEHRSAQTATLYGIFLNYIGSNVIGWYAGSETTKSHNVHMDNVKIHDLQHDTYENIAFSQGGATAFQRILNCLNAPFNAYHIFGGDEVERISQCNNYFEDNGDGAECQEWRENGLEYEGNTITDIQLLSFELINKYQLSWNYCSSGAADLAALVDFALRGTPFETNTPLLVGSHDPMIHPGKGVMALRFNGVDFVQMKDVKIENIHSQTGVGSMLGGKYSDVVSQQAPYMNGYSMNMANGLSLTFTTNVIMRNVDIDKVISNTGLAYGVAAWYETHVDIQGKKGLSIAQIHAGRELAPSSDFRSDSYPNLKPEGCAFRIYDDVIYKTVIKFNTNAKSAQNVDIECISGHTGCHFENNEYSNIGSVRQCSDEIKEKRSENGIFIVLAAAAILSMAILFVFCAQNTMITMNGHKYNEYTPLINKEEQNL